MYRAVRGRSIAAVIGAVVALVASANVGLAAQGPGSFRATGPYAVGNNPKDATVADLDGDGFDDVLTTVIYDNQVAVSRADGHGGQVRSVRFSADGRKLVSAGCDATVRVWDVATGAGRVLTREPAACGEPPVFPMLGS